MVVVCFAGTGIGLHMISMISQSNIDNPKGVILEAPFNNIREEVMKHPFSWVRQWHKSKQKKISRKNPFSRQERHTHFGEDEMG
jgi:hypothetical protein